jgi:hypothetical protein
MVRFLVYVTAHELNTLFGDGELPRLFLRWHSSEAKLTRRQRIRVLTRLDRLTEANPVEVISERGSPAHTGRYPAPACGAARREGDTPMTCGMVGHVRRNRTRSIRSSCDYCIET